MSELIYSNKGGAISCLIPSSEVIISTKKKAMKVVAKSKEDIQEKEKSSADHALWGTINNDLPQSLQLDAEFNPLITGIIRMISQMNYSGGFGYGFRKVTDQGKEFFKPIIDTEIERFLRDNQLHKVLMACFLDLNAYSMAFPQIILDQSKEPKIKRIMNHTTRARACRVDQVNSRGDHQKVYVNQLWGLSGFNPKDTKPYTALPEFDKINFMKNSKERQFIEVLKIPDLGRVNHTHPDWNAVRNSDWLEIAELIASFKKYIIQNQVSIKYHIEIDEQYWPNRFGSEEWQAMELKERQKNQREEIDAWAKFMQNPENKGNLQVTTMKWDELKGTHRSYWKLHELKGVISKEGIYMEDSREASENIMVAFGMHPDILGNAPGVTLGAGSGSGNRVAFNQRLSMVKFTQDLLMNTLNMVADFNGWTERIQKEDPEGVFQFTTRDSLITTLDTGAEATKPAMN